MGHKLAIALGGGGVRGLANIGVLKALEDSGLQPDIVTGTSMGAIVGAVYADTRSAQKTEEIIKTYLGSEDFIKQTQSLSVSDDPDKGWLEKIFDTAKKGYFFYRFFMRESVVSESVFLELDRLVPDKHFSELKLPFACIALDLISGLPEIFHGGELRPAVRASSAVPGMMPPVSIRAGMYVDGGWAESVPVTPAVFLGADFIIASDVTRDITNIDYIGQIKSSMDILQRANDIARSLMNTYRTRRADFVLHPDIGDAPWSAFDNIDGYITSGYDCALKHMPALKRALKRGRFTRLWKMRAR
jgi:NTE family protein